MTGGEAVVSRVLAPLILALCLVGSTSAPQVLAEPEQAGTCAAWDVSGAWGFQTSDGSTLDVTFSQNRWGTLTGTFDTHTGTRGSLVGGIKGASLAFRFPSVNWTLRTTVKADGKSMSGNCQSPNYRCSVLGTGQARCLTAAPPPAPNDIDVAVSWGAYMYRFRSSGVGTSALAADGVLRPAQGPAPGAGRPPTIAWTWQQTSVTIEATFRGNGLPNTIAVAVRANGGQRTVIGVLTRVRDVPGGAVYRGTVTILPVAPPSPGRSERDDVVLLDPFVAWREYLVLTLIQQMIDPSGYVYDATDRRRLADADVRVYQRQGSSWVLWDAAYYGQTNPMPSNANGHYGWDVPAGEYVVRVAKHCYRDAESALLVIPPPRTDVNMGLSPAGCASVRIDDIATADDTAAPAAEFARGDPFQVNVVVSNAGTKMQSARVDWTILDPAGRKIESLSGWANLDVATFGSDLIIDGTVPDNADEGTYTSMVSLTHGDQTSLRLTTIEVSATRPGTTVWIPLAAKNGSFGREPSYPPTPTHTPFAWPTETRPALPSDTPGLRPSATPSPSLGGIAGNVTDGGAPAAGVELHLDQWDGSSSTEVANVRTDAAGKYVFANVPSLQAGMAFYVQYGPNTAETNRVGYFYGPPIRSYTAGRAATGGDFDIADVVLVAPDPGATAALPVRFSWQRRGLPGDTYRMRLLDRESGKVWLTNDLGDTGSVTITGLPADMSFGKVYWWSARVYHGPDSYGESHYMRAVTFAAATGITGRVTNRGAPDPNITLNLRWYDGQQWSTRATVTTDTNGRYTFIGVPGLGVGESYYVRFGPNTTDANRLWSWVGPTMQAYTTGASAPGGDFDVANVPLASPAHGALVRLPTTFVWQQRGVAGDTFRWWLQDPATDDAWSSTNFLTGDRFTLSALPEGAVYDRPYQWYVRVYNGDNGYGISFPNDVMFAP
jgi:5-hydroxyisourate hydrolase-like protein (transthyretin family)